MIVKLLVAAALSCAPGIAFAQTVPTLGRSGVSTGVPIVPPPGFPVTIPYDIEQALGQKLDLAAPGQSIGRKTVFVGGVSANFATLGDAKRNAAMLAAGNIGLYQHANGIAPLSVGQRQALWATWGVTGVTPTGQGETVGEVGGFTPPDAGYLSYFGGAYPQQVNMNIITGSGDGSGTYTASGADAHPGTAYQGYTSAADLATMKAAIAAAMNAGTKNVAIYMTPNGGGEDLDDAFATGAYWANVRAAALFGGGIALDVPPTYWVTRGTPYQKIVTQMVAWANSVGIRSSFTVSPFFVGTDAAGNTGGCAYDSALSTNTRLVVAALKAANAMPTQWVVENYCGDPAGNPNGYEAAASANSLNQVALYLARTTIPALPGAGPAGANGVSSAAQMASVRTGPLRLADVLGAGTMAGQDSEAVSISGGTIGGNTVIITTGTPLFLNGVLVQGTATAAYIDGNTANAITFGRPDGSPLRLRLPAGDLQPQTIGALDGARPTVIATHGLDVDGALAFNGTRFVISSGLPTSDPHILGVMYEDSAGRLYRSHGP